MDYKHLVTFEQEIMSFTAAISELYYRIESSTILRLLRKDYNGYSGNFEKEYTFEYSFSPALTDEKKILESFLIEFLSHVGNLYGNPWYQSSPFFTKEEFEKIDETSNQIISDRKEKIRQIAQQTPIIQFCEQHSLYPEPEGSSPNNWYANCPSGGQHRIMVSTQSQTWGCGYCKKKGELEDLKNWVEQKKALQQV